MQLSLDPLSKIVVPTNCTHGEQGSQFLVHDLLKLVGLVKQSRAGVEEAGIIAEYH